MLILFILICEAAGAIGAWLGTSQIGGWYETLAKPAFNPPPWVFGPVWVILYALMGTAMYFVYKKGGRNARGALVFFGIHLFFNAMWSIIFFNWQRTGWALLDLVLMWGMIWISIYLFAKFSRAAAWLLVPYLAWVSFAGALNFAIWNLNG